MGGTPLNNALILVPQLIKEFREKTGAQKVSFCCITDGASSPLQYYQTRTYTNGDKTTRAHYAYYDRLMIRSGYHQYPVDTSGNDTADVVKWLQTQVEDVAVSNIFLGKQSKAGTYLFRYGAKLDEKQFRKIGYYVTTSNAWPILGVINPTSFSDTTDEIEVEEGASKAKIKTALNKMLKTKQSARMILTELVGQFA